MISSASSSGRKKRSDDQSIATRTSGAELADVALLPPKRPTRARLQTFFLRQFARSGSLSDASARTGIAPRTVQRWRAGNPAFAARYDAVLAERVGNLEDLAMRRALGADRRPIFHKGKQVATVDRQNDVMLMRVLARFDRLAERRAARSSAPSDRFADAEAEIRALDEAGERAQRMERQQIDGETRSENVVVQATR